MTGMSPEQFKEALRELAGGNVYKKYFINSDTDREVGIFDNICVLPEYDSHICDGGIKYVEAKFIILLKNNEKIFVIFQILLIK